VIRLHRHVWVDGGDGFGRRFDLRHADVAGAVNDLTLQVRQVHHIIIDDADRADAGGRQIHRGRRSQTARADDQHSRGEQLLLSAYADLLQNQMPRISLQLVIRESHVLLPCQRHPSATSPDSSMYAQHSVTEERYFAQGAHGRPFCDGHPRRAPGWG